MSRVRRAIELLVTRVLRSRVGVALVLAAVVIGLVGTARTFAGPDDPAAGPVGAPVGPISTVDPHVGDDGAIATQPPSTPPPPPGAAPAEQVARGFATAWLTHRDVSAGEWRTALLPFSTPALAEKLTGVDPAGVPAQRLTGEATLIIRSARLVEVTLPVDSGRLRLELVAPDGRWLVDVVDWERS